MKHTPGPWKFDVSIISESLIVEALDGTRIAVINNRNEEGDNAKLIAAAPELLEALQSLTLSVLVHSDCTNNSEFMTLASIAQEAIKKATE